MVRLKALKCLLTIATNGNFNSTMVRLKVIRLSSYFVGWWKFQFHYGTIKSFSEKNSYYAYMPFQFHYGTIKRMSDEDAKRIIELFQFHYGTIKRKRT